MDKRQKFIPGSCWSILFVIAGVGMLIHSASWHLRYPDMTATRMAMQGDYIIPVLIMGAILLFATIMKDRQ